MRLISSLVVAVVVGLGAVSPVLADDTARITVSGEGRVEAAPDMATLSLGVTTQADTAAAALAANSQQLAVVLDRLRAAGIAARDLQTSGLSMQPNWDYSNNAAPRITGYVASNMLTVRVRALDTLGTVLDSAVRDGANTFNGLGFALADPAAALDEARRRAVADARHKAELLAEAAGVTLGPVVSISEGGGGGQPAPMYRSAAMAAEAVPVAEGEVLLSAQVSIVYAILP
jgi:uncharacterized protein